MLVAAADLRMMIWQTKLRKENPMQADTHKPAADNI
jgi:hypothetical protein